MEWVFQKIFDKLGEPYISKNNEGMGLGIFIAKNLLKIWVEKLNFNSADNNAVVEINFKNSILIYMNMKLLIVDDDLPFRERLSRSMEKKGF